MAIDTAVRYEIDTNEVEVLLEKLYEAYRKCTNEADKKIISTDILHVIDLLDKLGYYAKESAQPTFIHEPLIKKVRRDAEIYTANQEMIDALLEFNRSVKNPRLIDHDMEPLGLTDEEIFTLVHDFYRDRLPTFFAPFMKLFDKRERRVHFLEADTTDQEFGAMHPIYSLKDFFITINDDETAETILSAVHEEMHGTSLIINPKHLYSPSKFYLEEVDSYFAELVAIQHFSETMPNGIDYEYAAAKNIEAILNKAKTVQMKMQSIRDVKDNKLRYNQDILNLYRRQNMAGREVYNMFKRDLKKDSYYGYPFLIAIELFHMYLNDPEYAQFILKQLIEWEEPLDRARMIECLGINVNQHSKEFAEAVCLKFRKQDVPRV